MAAIQDGMGALITYLQAQSDISSLLSDRVYGLEVPEEEAVSMPRKAIIIKDAGGIRAADYSDINKNRYDFWCCGETPFEARKVWRTLVPILQLFERTVSDSTLLFSASHSAGPFNLRDQPTEWPYTIDTWLVMMSETLCP